MRNEFIYHNGGEKENTNESNILETKKGKDQDNASGQELECN